MASYDDLTDEDCIQRGVEFLACGRTMPADLANRLIELGQGDVFGLTGGDSDSDEDSCIGCTGECAACPCY